MTLSTANIFDLDDTLIMTSARVIVRKKDTGDLVRYIPTSEYNADPDHSNLLDSESEYFDFSEFNDPDRIVDEELTNVCGFFVAILEIGQPTFIVTSREDPELVRTWVRSLNLLNTDSLGIFCTFDPDFPWKTDEDGNVLDDAQRKLMVLRHIHDKAGCTDFRIWEDSPGNLAAMKRITEIYPDVKVTEMPVN